MRALCLLLVLAPAVALGAKPKTTVVVTSPVDGATVEIDGKVVGKTPLKPQVVSPGSHTVKVRRLGYLELKETISVAAGKSAQVLADLLPFAGVIKVTAVPKDAQVFVDGKLVGKAPLEQEVKLGRHTVSISAVGYDAFNKLISAEPGNTYDIDAKLKKSSGGDDLELEPLAVVPKKKSGGDVDDLALEPLASGASSKQPEILTASPVGPLTPPGQPIAGVEIAAAKPWYMEYWVWGAAAAVVVGGVVTAVVLTSGDDDKRTSYDLGWRPVDSTFDPNKGALHLAP